MNTAIIKVIYMFIIVPFFFLFLYTHVESLIMVPITYETSVEQVYKLLLKPEKQAHLIIKKIGSHSPISGILATYAGYLSSSNNYGEIIFSRHQQKTPLYIAITPILEPIMRMGNNVDHWEFSKTANIAFFRVDISSNVKNGFLTISVNEEPIPVDFVVPYPTLTIFAKPKYFDMPTGIFESPETDHWILPSIKLKKDIYLEKNSILTLPFLQLFEPIHTIIKKEPKRKMIRLQN